MANETMRDGWSSWGHTWVRNERTFDAAFAPFTAAVVGAADFGTATRVLDVGCGSGTLVAAAVAAGVDAVGIDISPAMADAAQARTPSAVAIAADAQSTDLLAAAPGPPFDRVVSRFGVMFFEDPVAAFANIRNATSPGTRLVFACWRSGEHDMFTLGTGPLNARLDEPLSPSKHGVPGAMAFADGDRVHEVLGAAGWADISTEPVDGLCDYSIDGSDGVEERLAVALGGSIGRAAQAELEPKLGPEGWAEVLDEAREDLRRHLVDGAVRCIGHTWLVTATNPG